MHAEIKCEITSRLGARIRFTIALADSEHFTQQQVVDINHAAAGESRSPVFVAPTRGIHQLSRQDFLAVLGGAVPSWRALSREYSEQLLIVSKNQIPSSMSGEAWEIFEDMVADGLEFCFGRRVQRYGGRRRGVRVSDMHALVPNQGVVVVDAKASATGFDATWPSLRPLVEYTEQQKDRQQALIKVLAALIVSSEFKQNKVRLDEVAGQFLGETRVALCFMTASVLAKTVSLLRQKPDIRNAIRWKVLLNGGLMEISHIRSEIKASSEQRYESGEN